MNRLPFLAAALICLTAIITAPDAEAEEPVPTADAREACTADAQGWSDWCSETERRLAASHLRLEALWDACEPIEHAHWDCEQQHQPGAPACALLATRVDDCDRQREDLRLERRDALVQMQHACTEATRIQAHCTALATVVPSSRR